MHARIVFPASETQAAHAFQDPTAGSETSRRRERARASPRENTRKKDEGGKGEATVPFRIFSIQTLSHVLSDNLVGDMVERSFSVEKRLFLVITMAYVAWLQSN